MYMLGINFMSMSLNLLRIIIQHKHLMLIYLYLFYGLSFFHKKKIYLNIESILILKK